MIDWQTADSEMKKLRHDFLGSLGDRLKSLQSYIHTGSSESVKILSHRLAGVAETYGFSALTQISGCLEDYLYEKVSESLDSTGIAIAGVLAEAIQYVMEKQEDSGHLLEDPRIKGLISASE
jgi:HPt (histidine-containing phosphotransfer) domain-containing protein